MRHALRVGSIPVVGDRVTTCLVVDERASAPPPMTLIEAGCARQASSALRNSASSVRSNWRALGIEDRELVERRAERIEVHVHQEAPPPLARDIGSLSFGLFTGSTHRLPEKLTLRSQPPVAEHRRPGREARVARQLSRQLEEKPLYLRNLFFHEGGL